MTKTLSGLLLTIFALVPSAFGQEKQEPAKKEKDGKVWYWFDGAKKCAVEWDQAVAFREKAFADLADRVKGGDKNKIRLHMGRINGAQFNISTAWACGSDYSRNLEKTAGIALTNTSGTFDTDGKMTEAEYDEAIKLVKTLREKIFHRPLTAEQKKIWAGALEAIGAVESLFTKIE